MHICLITSSRVFEIVFGGEEKFTKSLGEWLLNRGQKVTIVGRKLFGVEVVRGPYDASRVVDSKIKTTHPRLLQLPYPMFMLSMLVTSLLFVLRILAVNRESRISVIHAQDTGYGGLAAVLSAKLLRVPVILSSHGLRYFTIGNALKGVYASLSLPWEYWLDVFTSKHADLIINVSSSGEEFFAKIGLENRKMRMIPIGIDTSVSNETEKVRLTVRKKLGVHNEILIGFIGRLAPEKNLLTLLEAFVRALRLTDKMKLILVGAGPMEGKLKMLSHDRGLDDVIIFAGIRHDIDRLLSAIDVFTLPSYTEGCPTSLLEAIASGKAVIASNIPSIREIVNHDEEALLVDPYNVEELEQAILSLYNDPELRAQMGRRAREKARIYDADSVYKRLLSLYEELVSH
ncbi:MAG: glycosyltransferase family 4 protein [Candidatus Bathyarchaeota archaeon]|jgi:glycosyltransferase involved in cell wall biosynthesis